MKFKFAALLGLVLSLLSVSIPKEVHASGAFPVYNLYSTTNVTSAAYVQLVASTAKGSTDICASNTGGTDVYIALGSAGNESNKLLIPSTTLNTQTCYHMAAPYGSRISAKTITATASSGELDLNLIYYSARS